MLKCESSKGDTTMVNFITSNYVTILLILSLFVVMYAYRDLNIPATALFPVAASLLLVSCIAAHVDSSISMLPYPDYLPYQRARLIASVIGYIVRPLYILIETTILIPNKKIRLSLFIPAAINTVIYSIAPFTGDLVFQINNNNWHSGRLARTVYFVCFFYLIELIIASANFFYDTKTKKGVSSILFFILFINIITMIFEWRYIAAGYVETVSALSMLLYYVYLSHVYLRDTQQKLIEHEISLKDKELDLEKSNLKILQGQIKSHFIFNTLGVIRSLTKRDSAKAIECIDSFSDYLGAHIESLKSPKLITFEEELSHVKTFVSLSQFDESKRIKVEYDLETTNFMLPPLSLEPLIENAIKYGQHTKALGGSGSVNTILISTFLKGDNLILSVENRALGADDKVNDNITDFKSLGVGLKNTAARIKMLLNGRLALNVPGKKIAAVQAPSDGSEYGDISSDIIPKTSAGRTPNMSYAQIIMPIPQSLK